MMSSQRKEPPLRRHGQDEIGGEFGGAHLFQHGFHGAGLVFARENRRLYQSGEVGILFDQSAQGDEVALHRFDGFFFLGQLENGVRVAPCQSAFVSLFRRHIRPSAGPVFDIRAGRPTG